MRFVTLGANGPTGRLVVQAALARGWDVTAAVSGHFSEAGWIGQTLRPPRLSNRRGNGAYRTSTAGPVAGSGSIYRTDLADASIDVIDKTETLCKTIWVAS